MEPALLTIGIILVTCVFSFIGFRNSDFEAKHIFCPEYILSYKEYHRVVSSAFLHSGFSHLAFNMLSLYCFATPIEMVYGKSTLALIYFGSIIGGSLLSLFIHRHHEYFAYGASGGVCGVIFAYIFLFPGSDIYMFFIPIGIPAWLYAIGFLIGSFFAMKGGREKVAHDAHLGGAIIGLAIVTLLRPQIIEQSPKLFATVAVISGLLLYYIIRNPLFLPLAAFRESKGSVRALKSPFRSATKKRFDVDDLLDKISREGLDSLSKEERAYLESMSEKFRRRAEAKKPESELYF